MRLPKLRCISRYAHLPVGGPTVTFDLVPNCIPAATRLHTFTVTVLHTRCGCYLHCSWLIYGITVVFTGDSEGCAVVPLLVVGRLRYVER